MYINTFIVFLISGFWHGAAWTFVIWGILHGIAMIVSKLLRQCKIVFPKALGWLFTFSFWVLSFSIFRAASLQEAVGLFKRILKGGIGRIQEFFYATIEKTVEISILQKLDMFDITKAYPEVWVLAMVFLSLVGCLLMKNTQEKLEEFRFTYRKLFVTVFLIFYSLISLGKVTVFLYANY